MCIRSVQKLRPRCNVLSVAIWRHVFLLPSNRRFRKVDLSLRRRNPFRWVRYANLRLFVLHYKSEIIALVTILFYNLCILHIFFLSHNLHNRSNSYYQISKELFQECPRGLVDFSKLYRNIVMSRNRDNRTAVLKNRVCIDEFCNISTITKCSCLWFLLRCSRPLIHLHL